MRTRLLLAVSLLATLLPLGPSAHAASVSTACDSRPDTEVPADARINGDFGFPTRFLADVDGDGHRDVVTGYMLGGELAADRDSYLHVELASGWGTTFQLDSLDEFSGFPMAEPGRVITMGGQRLIVIQIEGNAVGADVAFFAFRDCALVPIELAGGGFPEIWSGGGLMHSEWPSCRANDVVMLDLFRGFDQDGNVVSEIMIGGNAKVYRLDHDGFHPDGTVPLHLPRNVFDLLRVFPDCSSFVGTFVDDNGSVFQPSIEWLAFEGITRGCNPPRNDRYCPTDELTRGEMAAFLARALGYTDDGGGNLFVDDDGSVFEAAIDKLATAGVTKGCNPPANDRFCPDRRVTRAEMAAFFTRALGLTDDGGGNLFVDDDGSVFESSIDRLGAAGITEGCNPPTNDRFCPDEYVTRGQVAAFLKRALG
jgi:ribosomal protein L24E